MAARFVRPLAASITTAAVLAGCASTTPDPQALLRQADLALGASSLQTLRYSARGTGTTFGQAFQPGNAWPALSYASFTRTIDYGRAAMREDFARSRAEPTGGGALPLMGQGEQRASAFSLGEQAWTLAGATATPSLVSVDDRVHALWTTPHGAIKSAQQHGASTGTRSDGGASYSTFSWRVPGRMEATAWVDAQGRITRIDSRMPHPVLGDAEFTTHFSDYRAFGPIHFPMQIRQTQDGRPVFDLQVQEVQPNAPADIVLPDNVRSTTAERVLSEQVAPGVWFLFGGSHNSVAIEMSNHVVLVEAPLYEGRTAAVFAEVKKLLPGKPIRTVINSHHHFDHAGGLRAAVAEGASLVTSQQAKPYFERVLAQGSRVRPGAGAVRAPEVFGVQSRREFVDGDRRFEVHEITGSVHAQGFLMVYLPKEKLLIEADAYTPAAPNTAPPAVPNGNHVNLVQNIERLGLQVERILPLHGRVVPIGELYTGIGRARP